MILDYSQNNIFLKMFKKFFAALSIASLSTVTPSFAQEDTTKGFYLTGAVGLGQMADIDIHSSDGGGVMEFESGFAGDLGFGYDFGTIRTQFTYSSLNTDLSKVQGTTVDVGVDVSSFLFEGAIDFRDGKDWQPYIGLGVGQSEISVNLAKTVGNVNIIVGDDNITSVIGKVGVAYKASDTVDVYAEGWALAFDDFKIGTVEFYGCGMTGASIGLRVRI